MERRELKDAGQGVQHPVCALGWRSLRISVSSSLPATRPKILSREKVMFKVLSVELLLRARHCAGCVMNISTDTMAQPIL